MSENSEIRSIKDQLNDLQTQFSFQEDTLVALNDAVIQQQTAIGRLQEQNKHLKLLLDNALPQLDGGGVLNERPPHY